MDPSEYEEQQRIARKAKAFEVWLDNLPMAGRPDRGDPAIRERAEKVLDEQPPRDEDE